MIKNFFKIALRNLIKQRVYSIINIVGLATGVASCLLIMLYVTHELSYDNFHPDGDRIYKVALERIYPTHRTNYAIIPHSYADVIEQDFPEVDKVLRMGGPANNVVVTYQENEEILKQFEESRIMAADSGFFKFFTFKLLKGTPDKVLLNNTDLVITEATAKRYFGNEDPIGKTLNFFNQEFSITGVCENVPDNSHLQFDFLTKWSEDLFGNGLRNNFISFSAHVYIMLKPEANNAKVIEAKFPQLVDTYAAAQIEQDLGKSWEDYKREGNGYRYFLQPVKDIHLDPTNLEAKIQPGGNIHYVYFLMVIAGLILLIACINFMNLATARSAERAKEVGVRKTMGSLKGQLVSQFLIESIVLCFLATVLAVAIAYVTLPYFNSLAQQQLAISLTPKLITLLLTGIVVVGVLAGSYPAFALSSFNPVAVMKGRFAGNQKGGWLRNGLVVFQFTISIILIIGTVVVGEQMRFMQNKSLGYDKEQLLIVERTFALNDRVQTFVDRVKTLPDVTHAFTSFALLGRQGDYFGSQFLPEGSTEILTTKTMVIDDAFAQSIGFDIVQGNTFSEETQDSLSVMLNESALKTMDLSDPIGKRIALNQRTPQGVITTNLTIVGVVKDFNFQSLRDPVTPLVIRSNESFGGGAVYTYVKVSGNLSNAIAGVEQLWKELAPEQPFKYLFLDQELQGLYEAEKRAGNIFAVFSGLAIIIACVGLFGLSAYTASLRTKEIGVRKVLGASIGSVVLLLSKDFTRLIIVAIVLAIPVGWYIMNNWLDGFAYHISLSPLTFIIAGGTALLIAWLTVSYQSIKAAMTNPVKSLRSE